MVRKLYFLIGFCVVAIISTYLVLYQHPLAVIRTDGSNPIMLGSSHPDRISALLENLADELITDGEESQLTFSTSPDLLITHDLKSTQITAIKPLTPQKIPSFKEPKSTKSIALNITTYKSTMRSNLSQSMAVKRMTSKQISTFSGLEKSTATFNLTTSKTLRGTENKTTSSNLKASKTIANLSEIENKITTLNITQSTPKYMPKESISSEKVETINNSNSTTPASTIPSQTKNLNGVNRGPQAVTPSQEQKTGKPNRVPLILLYHVLHGSPNWWFKKTDEDFRGCPHMCQITNNKSDFSTADMVIFESPRYIKMNKSSTIYLEYFRDWGDWPDKIGNENQVRLFYAREPQTAGISGNELAFAKQLFNYSITFLKESDIFYPYGHASKRAREDLVQPDLASSKSKKILWIVSNCYSQRRMKYKEELNKYIQVDMLGACNKTHGDPCKRDYRCVRDMKMKYKFYLAFENTQCKEYISEKFWKSLADYMVPVVMGAPIQDYERVAPPHSFIHVDDFAGPKELADYLILLDKNNSLYNEYHRWRSSYSIGYENANCQICRLANEKPRQILDITKLWNAASQCTNPPG